MGISSAGLAGFSRCFSVDLECIFLFPSISSKDFQVGADHMQLPSRGMTCSAEYCSRVGLHDKT